MAEDLPEDQHPVIPDRPISATDVETIQEFVFQQKMSAGPLPSPEALQGYDNVVPGCADRIVRMAEKQADHRQLLERTVITGGAKRANQGLWLGFVVVVLVLAASVWLITNGYEIYGTILGSVDLVSLAAVFVYGRSEQRRERERKAAQFQSPTE